MFGKRYDGRRIRTMEPIPRMMPYLMTVSYTHLGLAVEIPQGYAGLVYARSGMAMKRGLAPANKVGVIDADYRGEVMVALHNHGRETQTVEAGERIAQLVVTPFLRVEYEAAEELSDTCRGAGGFGSTGSK